MKREVERKMYNDLITKLDNMVGDIYNSLHNNDFNLDKFYVTIGVKGENYDIPLNADLYEELRRTLVEMKAMVDE